MEDLDTGVLDRDCFSPELLESRNRGWFRNHHGIDNRFSLASRTGMLTCVAWLSYELIRFAGIGPRVNGLRARLAGADG